MKERRAIGIFDSGIGGLTILKEIEKKLPNEDIIYFGDNKRAPYGDRETEEVLNFCFEIVEFLKTEKVKLIVVACNTATAICVEALEKEIKIPIVGVIMPGAKGAIKKTLTKKIGILSTPLTAKTNAYKKEIKKIDKSIEVFEVGCGPLCQMIESHWQDTQENQKLLKKYIDRLPEKVDTVVLGCTHYPIIKKNFEAQLSGRKTVDPARETAKDVILKLKLNKIENLLTVDRKVSFYTSGIVEEFDKLAKGILGRKIKSIKKEL
ncbi:MAG: glutamate racemase [Psychrilyobacter sp.]|nr:glutamate racemase [Psychrilyobacter sp.]